MNCSTEMQRRQTVAHNHFPLHVTVCSQINFYERDSSRQHFTSAKRMKLIKSTSQAQCGWGASPTMLIGTTGLLPLLGEDLAAPWRTPERSRSMLMPKCWIWFFLYENLWLKLERGKNDNEKKYLHDTSTLPSRVHLPIYKTNLVADFHTLIMI